jgi:uncharacterized protein (DUF433 family)
MSHLRIALETAEKVCGVKRLLLNEKLRTSAGEILLDEYGKMINLGRSGQIAMHNSFKASLKMIDWGNYGPEQFFPGFVIVSASIQEAPRLIVINPSVSFGKPVLASNMRIKVSTIVSRIDANESEDAIALDYGIERREVDAAIDFYNRAA